MIQYRLVLYLRTILEYWERLISGVILSIVVPPRHRKFLSVTMTDPKFTFNGLVKLNTGRPSFGNETLLSHIRKTCENGLIL